MNDRIINDFVIEDGMLLASKKHIEDTDIFMILVDSCFSSGAFEAEVSSAQRFYIDSTVSEGLSLLYLFAESFGCWKIRFTTDGPVYEGIPTYE
jgi:hypothetical protein